MPLSLSNHHAPATIGADENSPVHFRGRAGALRNTCRVQCQGKRVPQGTAELFFIHGQIMLFQNHFPFVGEADFGMMARLVGNVTNRRRNL